VLVFLPRQANLAHHVRKQIQRLLQRETRATYVAPRAVRQFACLLQCLTLVIAPYRGEPQSSALRSALYPQKAGVAAMQPDAGESLVDLASKMPSASKNLLPDTNGFFSLDPKVFHADFGADLPAAQDRFLSIGQMPLAVAAASTKANVAAWHQKPSFGIVATEDRLINPDLQRFMYRRVNDAITEVKASHAVFLSQPRAVALVIEKAARAAAPAHSSAGSRNLALNSGTINDATTARVMVRVGDL